MKRVVFEHPDGLAQILGYVPDGGTVPIVIPLQGMPAMELRGRVVAFASLVRMTPRAAFYREPMIPASYSFHAAQQ